MSGINHLLPALVVVLICSATLSPELGSDGRIHRNRPGLQVDLVDGTTLRGHLEESSRITPAVLRLRTDKGRVVDLARPLIRAVAPHYPIRLVGQERPERDARVERRARRLVAALAAPGGPCRERAERDLMALGPQARPILGLGALSPIPEVRMRVARILRHLDIQAGRLPLQPSRSR